GVVDDHHGAVVKVRHALVVFLAFFQDEHAHGFARQDDRLERIGEFVDVEDFDALKLRDLVEVEVVGDDLSLVHLGQFNQLHVNFTNGGEVVFDDLDLEGRCLLQTLQDVEAAAAAVALERIGRVGDELEFAQDKLRDHDDAVEEAGFSDVGNAAVDDDA